MSNLILSQTYDQYEIKVDQNKAAENGISAKSTCNALE